MYICDHGKKKSLISFDVNVFFYNYTYSKQKTKSLKLAKELSDIVIYCKSVQFRGFEDSGTSSLLWDGLLQRGKSCETGGGIRCDVMTYAAQTQHGLLNTWDADLDSVQLHRFIMLQNTQSETCITSQMMVLHERDLWHNFEYGNEQVD